MENIKTTISLSNSKLGGFIPTVNLPTSVCDKKLPCQNGCYAKKGNWLYSNVKKSVANNLKMFLENKETFKSDIVNFLNNGLIVYKYFRWFSSGDIVNYSFLKMMVEIANECPQTQFLCFTKKFSIVNSYLSLGYEMPKNLHIVFSGWDKTFSFDNPFNLPTTYLHHKKKSDLHLNIMVENAYSCSGKCEKCLKCWNLEKGESVIFKKH